MVPASSSHRRHEICQTMAAASKAGTLLSTRCPAEAGLYERWGGELAATWANCPTLVEGV